MSPLKTLAKSALSAAYLYSGAARVQEWLCWRAGRRFMVILLFHRVTDQIPEDGLTVSTGRFRALCRRLRRRFHVAPLAEVFDAARSGRDMPPRTVAVTFDDCYRDNLFAARVLAEHGLPAAFFVPTGFVGTRHAFPWDRGLPPMPNLTWDDVREMAAMGHEIGSHTVNHPNLGTAPHEEARREIFESKAVLERQLGRRVRWFAYPFGGKSNFRPEAAALVEEAGYDGCLSGYGGFVRPGADGRILPRDSSPCYQGLLNLELHLRGCLDWLYALKRGPAQPHSLEQCLGERMTAVAVGGGGASSAGLNGAEGRRHSSFGLSTARRPNSRPSARRSGRTRSTPRSIRLPRGFSKPRANDANLNERPHRRGQLELVRRLVGQQIELTPPRLDGPPDGIRQDHAARPHAGRHVQPPAHLVRINRVAAPHAVQRRGRLASHHQPQQFQVAALQQPAHHRVVKLEIMRRSEDAGLAASRPSRVVQLDQRLLAPFQAGRVGGAFQTHFTARPFLKGAQRARDVAAAAGGKAGEVSVPRPRQRDVRGAGRLDCLGGQANVPERGGEQRRHGAVAVHHGQDDLVPGSQHSRCRRPTPGPAQPSLRRRVRRSRSNDWSRGRGPRARRTPAARCGGTARRRDASAADAPAAPGRPAGRRRGTAPGAADGLAAGRRRSTRSTASRESGSTPVGRCGPEDRTMPAGGARPPSGRPRRSTKERGPTRRAAAPEKSDRPGRSVTVFLPGVRPQASETLP